MKKTIMPSWMWEDLKDFIKDFEGINELPEDEQRELANRSAYGDMEARKRLIVHNWRLVIHNVKKMIVEQPVGFSVKDIVQEGFTGLIIAADKYDCTKNIPFSAYASLRIRWAILDAMYKLSTIKISKDQVKKQKELIKAEIELSQKMGRVPTDLELAEKLNTTIDKIKELKLCKLQRKMECLDDLVSDDGHDTYLDFIESVEDSADTWKVIYHSQEEEDFDKLRVYAGYSKIFSSAYKIFNTKTLCRKFSQYQFSYKYAGGKGSILLSHPIISRIDASVIVNKKIDIIDFLKECTESRFKRCSEEILVNYFVDMYEDYYKSKKNLKHTVSEEITEEQRTRIFREFPDSPLCNEIKQAKSWGDILVYSIFNCAIKRFTSGEKSGQISLNGFVKNLKMFPKGEKIFPWNREHFRKINGWINGEHSSQNNEEAKHLINDFISALIFKGDIRWEFGASSPQFIDYLHKISLLRNIILQSDNPTMLYMRSIDDICSVYCIKNGYPLPEYEALFTELEKVQNEKRYEKSCVSKITEDGEVLDSWKTLTRVVSNDLMNIFLSDKETQKERLEEYVKSNPFVVHVKRNNSIHNAIGERFNAKKIPDFIHQCAKNLENKIRRTLDVDGGRTDYTFLIGRDLDAWLGGTFFITLEEFNNKAEREKFEREQFRNYLGYDSNSMKYVRNIIIATLFETEERITKEGMNKALSEMGFVHLNPLASTFDAIISQAIDLSLEPSIIEEIKTEVLGQDVGIF